MLTRIAELNEERGCIPEALKTAQPSLAIDERLVALDPTNAVWRNDVEVRQELVARLRVASG